MRSLLTFLIYFLSIVWLVVLARYDWKSRRLPNELTLGGALAALLLRVCLGGLGGLGNGLLGGLVGGLFLFLPFLLRGAGAGDVKMLFAVGCLLGYPQIIPALVFIVAFGGVIGVGMLWTGKTSGARLRHYLKCCFCYHYDRAAGRAALPPREPDKRQIPFGCAISAGTILLLGIQLWFYVQKLMA